MTLLHRILHQTLLFTLLATLLGTFLFSSHLLAAPLPKPQQPDIDVNGYILIDHHSGQVLAEKNADEPFPPASLTKIMVAYVIADELEKGHIAKDDMVEVSEKAWRTGGSRMFIEVGSKVSVRELVEGVIIQSGNDASVAMAEYISGSESAFAELMNYHAAQLGLTNTHFVNSSGLPNDAHVSTVRDMARLSQVLINRFPDIYAIHAERTLTYNDIKQNNRNLLLWRDESVDGIKTGHTDAAGYCLVASAVRNDMRLISVVKGSQNDETRTSQSQTLLNYGFRFYETHKLYEHNTPIQETRLWKGKRKIVPMGISEDMYVTILRGRYDDLDIVSEWDPVIQAPVQEGDRYGALTVSLGDELLAEAALVSLQNIDRGNIFRRWVDQFRLFFYRLFNR